MTAVMEDPLIAGMTIRRLLPLHESSRRLRDLCPECPRVYGVAVMSDVSRRRWWPLQAALTTDRLERMSASAAEELGNPAAATHQLAAVLAHAVLGRVVALVVLEGRAWDTGLENLWVHVDSEGTIDWLGVVDPTLRVLPDDPCRNAQGAEGTVELPGEAALTTWIAHRCHRSLTPLFSRLSRAGGGAVSVASMWHTVGSAVVVTATRVPMLAGAGESVGMRRDQAVLDALAGFGLPVRGQFPTRRQGLAKLGQPSLS